LVGQALPRLTLPPSTPTDPDPDPA
ncbi:MAG: hypothetical protein JWP61_2745, partial [Friedmanniella sp.]|nr:hypothetical protein [Friedmanniella sp.]